MSSYNKVVWSDGLFLKPHHFQQQSRFQERHAYRLASGSNGFNFGFTSISLNEELLVMGKVALVSASGIMPDGTPFDIPNEDMQPPILDISQGFTANELVYLCLPLSMDGGVEVQADASTTAKVGARFKAEQQAVRDNTVQSGELAELQISKASPVFMLGNQDLSAFSKLAVARIVEKNDDGVIKVDENFYPTMLSVGAAPKLRRLLQDISEGVVQRAQSIAGRIGRPDQNGVADVSDFLMLQALNKYSPVLRHMNRLQVLHPRDVYETLMQMVGELSTFIAEDKLAPDIAAYDHDAPHKCWPDLLQQLRYLIHQTLEASAVPIPHERKRHGYVIAMLPERSLVKTSRFILAVKANVTQERLHRDFPAQSKVSSVDHIRELVAKQLPGVPLQLLPVAPRNLPYHANYSYFELDRSSSAWAQVSNAEGFGFHIAGEFPSLELQFWAIKE